MPETVASFVAAPAQTPGSKPHVRDSETECTIGRIHWSHVKVANYAKVRVLSSKIIMWYVVAGEAGFAH